MVGLAVNPEILPEVPQMFQLIIRFPPFTHWIFGRDLEPGINILGTSGCQGITVSHPYTLMNSLYPASYGIRISERTPRLI